MYGSLMLDIAGTTLTAEDRALLRQPQVGALIVFARNCEHPRQLRELCQSIRALRPELLVAIDQEGGRVQRLRRGVLNFPAMRTLGTHPEAEHLARDCAWLLATQMLACGVDFSFAPVLDVDYGRNSVIGSRAFAGTPERVTQLAEQFIAGLHEAGMAAVGKHFPGHGYADADSHHQIAQDPRSLAQLWESDLKPFAQLAGKLAAIMPAHVIYPAVDPDSAGFSRFWLQEVLRQRIGFNGVIFSDDLSMRGAHGAGDAGERAEAALNAGCDMALVCNDRAAAELALSRLQQLGVQANPALASMRRRALPGFDYPSQPRWLAAVTRLRRADLLA